MNTLVYDLSFGIRLPTPKSCPQPVTDLLIKCFYEKPNLRPDFIEIKDCLETAYRILISKTKPIGSDLDPKSSLDKVKHNEMKIRYVSVLKGNAKTDYTSWKLRDT